MKTTNKFISMILVILMLFSIIPLNMESLRADNINTDNWSLELSLYDSDVNNGQTPLLESTFNGTKTSDVKVLTMQVNYKHTGNTQTYPAGSLQIRVDGLQSIFYNRSHDAISADPHTSTNKEFNWSYQYFQGTYNSTTKKYDNCYYIFTNNYDIEANNNFEGSFQITYELRPQYAINGNSATYKASIGNKQSNTIKLTTNVAKMKYTLTKTAEKIAAYDGLPAGAANYTWVKYVFHLKENDGVIHGQDFLLRDTLPAGVIVVDRNFNVLTGNNNVYETVSFAKKYLNDTEWWNYLYVGYPSSFNGKTTSNTAEVLAQYPLVDIDTTFSLGRPAYESISRDDVSLSLDNFKFAYSGDLYGLEVKNYFSSDFHVSYNTLISNKVESKVSYEIYPYAKYVGNPITVRIYGDISGVTDTTGGYKQFQDGTYYFTRIRIPAFYNTNETLIAKDKYTIDVYVRKSNSTQYTKFTTLKTSNTSQSVSFTKADDIVSWYIQVNDMQEGIQCKIYNGIYADYRIKTQTGVKETGSIYNFGAIEAFFKDANGNLVKQNNVSLNSYDGITGKNIIAPYDQSLYGQYMQRDVEGMTYYMDSAFICTRHRITSKVNNPVKKQYEILYNQDFTLRLCHTVGKFNGINYYTLLPAGMELNATPEEIINTIKPYSSANLNNILIENNFATSNDFQNYLREHAKIIIKENWRGSGRTWLKLELDFSDKPLLVSMFAANQGTEVPFDWNLPTKVTYESILEYGRVYNNAFYVEGIFDDDVEPYYWGGGYSLDTIEDPYEADSNLKDNGSYFESIASDINENGKTNDDIGAGWNSTTITTAFESHQEVSVNVQTDQNNFTTGIADSSCNSNYSYKLKVSTGPSSITNFVLYSELESAFGTKGYWQGEFLGVDTSYATSKGYNVKVFYSTKVDNGKLGQDSNWKAYSNSVNKSTVKALAFQYLDSSGKAAIIPAQSLTYVLVNMKSPSNDKITTLAYHNCKTEWNAIASNGQIIDGIIGINSNIVKVALPNSIKDDSLPTLTLHFTKEIQGQQSDYNNLNIKDSPDFKLELISLTPDEAGNYYKITGLININKSLTITQIPIGTYLIKEYDDNYFDFVNMLSNNDSEIIIEGVTLNHTNNGYVLTIDEALQETVEFNIKVVNELESERFYEDVKTQDNLFLKNRGE